jgi:rod shape-determining protein MreC
VYDKHVRRRRAVLALLVGVSLILLTAYFGESAGSPLHTLQRGVIEVLSPVQEGASRALKPVRDLFGWFGDTLHAKQQRDQLEAQRDQLLHEAIGAQVAMRENVQLRGMLALDESNGLDAYTMRTARITGRSPNNLLGDTLQIDVGSGDGVRVGQAVVAAGGLVGHVSTVAASTAFVTLITDQRSIVTVRVLDRRGEWGLLKPSIGDPLDLLVQQLQRDAPIAIGQPVVTAGAISSRLESLYPPNSPVGRVTRADPQEIADGQQVHVTPFADLRHLDFVQILIARGRAGSDSSARAQAP